MEYLLLWHLQTGRQLVPVHQKDVPPVNLAHGYPILGRPRTRTSVSENPVGALVSVIMPLLTGPGDFFHLRQILLPGYSGMKWVSSRILFALSVSQEAASNRISSIVGCCMVATTRITMVFRPCTASSTWTWVNQPTTLVQQLG